MITYSGRSVWPTWTDVEGVPTDVGPSLEDIAVGLGRQSRFAGQTRDFYTVLCHSLTAGAIALELWPGEPMLRRHLLLHDGHEAMISDVPTTWKNDGTRADEAELDMRIAAEHLLAPLSEDQRHRLKWVDLACLAAEAHAIGHREADKWWPRENFDDVARMAHRMTEMHLVAGNPVRYLDPGNSIPALRRALSA